MTITKEKLLELAKYHHERSVFLEQQELYEACNYHLGRANAYEFLANMLDKED